MKLLLGITGSIAAYKTPDLVRQLRANGYEVKVILTEAAESFVTPLSLQAVAQQKIYQALFDDGTETGMAQCAKELGAEVTLISGPTSLALPSGVRFISVVTAQEMFKAVAANLMEQDIFISAAAVTDYYCASVAKQKIKKTGKTLTLTLQQTMDILAYVGNLSSRPYTVGFAAETENLLENARNKLIKKKIDLIVANDVSQPEMGFNSDENAVWLISAHKENYLDKAYKKNIAYQLLELIHSYFLNYQKQNELVSLAYTQNG